MLVTFCFPDLGFIQRKKLKSWMSIWGYFFILATLAVYPIPYSDLNPNGLLNSPPQTPSLTLNPTRAQLAGYYTLKTHSHSNERSVMRPQRIPKKGVIGVTIYSLIQVIG